MPMRQLYPADNVPEEESEIDIFAVHGLNPYGVPAEDHASNTWTAETREGRKLWLASELPKALPKSRIFLHKYDSTVGFGRDRTSFVDKAMSLLEDVRNEREDENRPIVFIGHSLGGLLIKQALITAHNNPNYSSIKVATRGLVFFATPHNGGNQALVAMGHLASSIARAVGFRDGDNIVKVLRSGTMFSDLMGELFRHQLSSYRIISFWGAYDAIVERNSAHLGLPGETEHIVALRADHTTICKFGSTVDDMDNFKIVKKNMLSVCHQALQRSPVRAFPEVPGARNRRLDEDEERSVKIAFLSREISTLINKYEGRPPFIQRLLFTCEALSSMMLRVYELVRHSSNAVGKANLQKLQTPLLEMLFQVKDMLPKAGHPDIPSLLEELENGYEFRACVDRMQSCRADLGILLNVMLVNTNVSFAPPPEAGTARPLRHPKLHMGGEMDPARIYHESLRRITDTMEFQHVRNEIRGQSHWFKKRIPRRKKPARLLEAVENKRPSVVFDLLNHGEDPNTHSPNGTPVLHWAVNSGPEDAAYTITCALVCCGAALNAKNMNGETALSLALRLRRPLKWIMMLCEMDDRETSHNERAVTIVDAEGQTVLHQTIKANLKIEYLILLISYGAEIDRREVILSSSAPPFPRPPPVQSGFIAVPIQPPPPAQQWLDLPPIDPSQPSPYLQSLEGLSPLHLAVEIGRVAFVSALMDFKAQVHSEDGYNPIQRACKKNNWVVLEVLCQYNIDLNDWQGDRTPLHIAAAKGHITSAEVLLDHGADPNLCLEQPEFRSPLYWAVEKGDTEMADLLLARGAEVEIGHRDESPLFCAVFHRNRAMVELLIEHRADLHHDHNGESPLICAVRRNHVDMVQMLLHQGANPNRGNGAEKPLFCAVSLNNSAISRILLDFNANVNCCWNGITPLELAAKANDTDMMIMLLRRGATPVYPPLLAAIHSNALQAVEVLLQERDVVHQVDAHGRTPLMNAIYWNRIDAAKLLIAYGSNVHHVDLVHCDVLGYAISLPTLNRVEILGMVDRLLSRGALPGLSSDIECIPGVIRAAGCGRDDIVQLMVTRNKAETTRTWYSPRCGTWTPIRMAISTGQIDMVKSLLRLGAKLDPDKPKVPSLLCLAAPYPAMIEFLVGKGFDINHQDAQGGTPLHQAIVVDRPPFSSITTILAQHGWPREAKSWKPLSHFLVQLDIVGGLRWIEFQGVGEGSPGDIATQMNLPLDAINALRGAGLTSFQSFGRSVGWIRSWVQ